MKKNVIDISFDVENISCEKRYYVCWYFGNIESI